jgi:hypothetical protein
LGKTQCVLSLCFSQSHGFTCTAHIVATDIHIGSHLLKSSGIFVLRFVPSITFHKSGNTAMGELDRLDVVRICKKSLPSGGFGLTILSQPSFLISPRLSYGSSTPNYGTSADDDGTLDPLDGFPRDPTAWFFDHAFHIGFRVPQATQFACKSRFRPLHIPMRPATHECFVECASLCRPHRVIDSL